MTEFRLALIQLAVSASKTDNLQRAAKLVTEAAKQGAKIVSLPECCNSPYGNNYFPEYAEPIPGESTESFAKSARDNNVFLVAGSIPEREGDKLYNTCTVFNPDGEMIAKHRKMHLFDIDIPGKITFQESKTLCPGNAFTMFKTHCDLLLYPGAFNMTTGPAHWQLLAQARALDNQLYVATISPARDDQASYVAWGHSTVINPWGEVTSTTEHSEDIVYAEIDPGYVKQVREQIPISHQRREDMYEVKDVSDPAS